MNYSNFNIYWLELEVPIDVDRFCNEIIEEGIAAQNADNGQGQTASPFQESTTQIGGTFIGEEGGESQGTGPAEIIDTNDGYQQQVTLQSFILGLKFILKQKIYSQNYYREKKFGS